MPHKSRIREWSVVALLSTYVVIVLLVTMSPTPVDQGFSSAIDKVLAVLHRNGVPEWFGYNKLEFSANIAMFAPIGFLVALALPARVWWLALIVCPAFSGGIEYVQGAVLTERFSTLSDLIANSIGAVIGILFAVILRALVHHRDEIMITEALRQRGIPA